MALLGSKRVDRKLANARVDRKLANARATLIGAGPSQTRRMLNKPMVYVEATEEKRTTRDPSLDNIEHHVAVYLAGLAK